MTLWIVARQALLSKEFSRQEHWSELLSPSPGELPSPGVDPGTSALPANSLPTEPSEVVNEYIYICTHIHMHKCYMATQLFLAILHKYLCFIIYLFLAYCILVLIYKFCLFSEYEI